FFFSSRRRHTRSDRDWSSDVCSSDLFGFISAKGHHPAYLEREDVDIVAVADVCPARLEAARAVAPAARLYADWRELLARETELEIGRASCRERVESGVGGGGVS